MREGERERERERDREREREGECEVMTEKLLNTMEPASHRFHKTHKIICMKREITFFRDLLVTNMIHLMLGKISC